MSLCVLQATCTMYVYVSSGDSNVHIERAITAALDAGCHNTK